MSTVIILLYIYILVTFHSSCQFVVDVFARPMHFTSEFAMTVLSKCVWSLKGCVASKTLALLFLTVVRQASETDSVGVKMCPETAKRLFLCSMTNAKKSVSWPPYLLCLLE